MGPEARRNQIRRALEAKRVEQLTEELYGPDPGALEPCSWCGTGCSPPLCPADPVAAEPFFASRFAPVNSAAPTARPHAYPDYDDRWALTRRDGRLPRRYRRGGQHVLPHGY